MGKARYDDGKKVTFRASDELIELLDRLATKRGYDRSQFLRYGVQIIAELSEMEPEIIRPYDDRADARRAVREFCLKHANEKAHRS